MDSNNGMTNNIPILDQDILDQDTRRRLITTPKTKWLFKYNIEPPPDAT